MKKPLYVNLDPDTLGYIFNGTHGDLSDFERKVDLYIEGYKGHGIEHRPFNIFCQNSIGPTDKVEFIADKFEKKTEDGTPVSIGMYIIEKKKILAVVRECVARGRHHLEKDFIQTGFYEGKITLGVHEFDGHVIRNDSIASYFANNLDLITNEALRRDLFDRTRPIYTKVRDEVPSYYSPHSTVADCLIADGCRIHGTLSKSVLFRDVYVGRGTTIKNSVIMQGAKIGEGCYVENAILDKNVTVSDGVKLIGAPAAPCIVEKGETV